MSKHKSRQLTTQAPPVPASALREPNANASATWNYEMLKERIAELELALEDQGWQRLGDNDREFSREGLRKITKMARLAWLKNPLVKRAVEVQNHYVFGQGVSISAKNAAVNEVVQAFLDDGKNQAELTAQQAMMAKEAELAVTGNLFFAFFSNNETGSNTGRPRVRSIPFDEIETIITDPEDAKTPWAYYRIWMQGTSQRTAYYPDWRYTGDGAIFGKDQPEVKLEETPVYHVAVNRLADMRFGVSEVYAALDWAMAYKSFLEDWATLTRAYSRFAHKLTLPAGAGGAGVAAAKAKLATTYSTSSGETNPPPTTGSTFIQAPGYSFDPIRIGGANVSAEDGRRLLLMVAASVGLPETFFSDASVGSLATAHSLDRPTELKMRARQSLWVSIFQNILRYVIEQAVRAGTLRGKVEDDDDGVPIIDLGMAVDADGKEAPIDATVNVEFPPLLEHDVTATVAAIVQATTLAGQQPAGTIDEKTVSRALLTALGVPDVDATMAIIFPVGGESLPAQMQRKRDEAKQAQIDALKQGQQQGQPPQSGQPPQEKPAEVPASEALMVEAVTELREAIAEFVKRHA